ncbi:MAG: mannose-6-phosphate isomerase, class I [Actinomycetota bacterium]
MTIPALLPLRNGEQRYAWGSPTAIPELLGREPDGEPVAELWIGAHPVLPSTVEIDGAVRRLDDLAAERPDELLGAAVTERFGGFPYLAKLLAAAQPLSLQAHPSIEQAEAGFDREETSGVAVDASNRCYRDRNHKPELIVALTDFEALCGFRPLVDAIELLRSVGGELTRPWIEVLETTPPGEGCLVVMAGVLDLPAEEGAALAAEVATGLRALAAADGDRWATTARLLIEIGELHPTDPGIVVAALLEDVRLAPGEALFLGAGNLHAYVRGLGVEVMASSDNVLRGGLTPKHVDVAELCDVVRPVIEPVPVVRPVDVAPGRAEYPVPVEDFSVSRVRPDAATSVDLDVGGPTVVLVTDGACRVDAPGSDGVDLGPGDAVLAVPAAERITCTGEGTAWVVAASPGRASRS